MTCACRKHAVNPDCVEHTTAVITEDNPMGIHYCATCKCDTLPTDEGVCLFCDKSIYTGKTEAWRKLHPRVCAGCGGELQAVSPGCRQCRDRANARRRKLAA